MRYSHLLLLAAERAMSLAVELVSLGVVLLAVAGAADYCSVCRDHTMCLYKVRPSW